MSGLNCLLCPLLIYQTHVLSTRLNMSHILPFIWRSICNRWLGRQMFDSTKICFRNLFCEDPEIEILHGLCEKHSQCTTCSSLKELLTQQCKTFLEKKTCAISKQEFTPKPYPFNLHNWPITSTSNHSMEFLKLLKGFKVTKETTCSKMSTVFLHYKTSP